MQISMCHTFSTLLLEAIKATCHTNLNYGRRCEQIKSFRNREILDSQFHNTAIVFADFS